MGTSTRSLWWCSFSQTMALPVPQSQSSGSATSDGESKLEMSSYFDQVDDSEFIPASRQQVEIRSKNYFTSQLVHVRAGGANGRTVTIAAHSFSHQGSEPAC